MATEFHNLQELRQSPSLATKVFIQRDYSEGTVCRFQIKFPSELGSRIERTLFEDTVKTLNTYYAEAEKVGGQSYMEGCLACATAYFIFLCMETRYEKLPLCLWLLSPLPHLTTQLPCSGFYSPPLPWIPLRTRLPCSTQLTPTSVSTSGFSATHPSFSGSALHISKCNNKYFGSFIPVSSSESALVFPCVAPLNSTIWPRDEPSRLHYSSPKYCWSRRPI
ncbi:uncharacterized protein LOC112256573 isoform X1 [Oncorhynchus tshawytscha]|uniref:Golgin subfamily A member 7/ERF4 domain-containing protein n=1 Tax=Oncorhynchus tshawytscha TaxID=74940 RepID=A0AAZ3RQ62_ONCTS|nr:uncharacterized protein LOC112256573 isoform X1 [Oncorhynchus tshawytscha]